MSTGLAPFCSEYGWVTGSSSFGSTMLTASGRGFFGPLLPVWSNGNMIFTLMPRTPDGDNKHRLNSTVGH